MNPSLRETIENHRQAAKDLRDYRKYSLILAVEILTVSVKAACKFFEYSVSSYYRINQEITDAVSSQTQKGSWGGRRKSYLTHEQEEELAIELSKKAGSGGFVDIGQIKVMIEEKVGKVLHKTTIYRFLERHGFRKVAPRQYHPKQNLEAQEAFKKTSPL